MSDHQTRSRAAYNESDLIRRGDVIDRITERMLAARGKRDDGYEDACTDILDALTGWCHENYTIKAVNATPDRAAGALKEVRARVYSCTSIRPDGERVIPQDRMLRIIENVLKEYGGE